MGYESPNVTLIDWNGNALPVQNATAIPASTPALLIAGSDGTNSRYVTIDSSGRFITAGAGTAGTPAGGVLSIQGVSGGQAVPISGTVTANNASVSATGSAVPASATFIGGSVTTAAPTYTNGNLGALSLTTAGLLRVDASATTITITGTVAATQSGTWNINNISGTVSLPTGAATESSLAKLTLAQGSTTSGQSGSLHMAAVTTAAPSYTNGQTSPLSLDTTGALRVNVTAGGGSNASVSTINAATPGSATFVGGAVATSAPTYTNGNMSALSLTTAGALRVDGSAVTQPITMGANTNGTLGALNATVTAPCSGVVSIGFQIGNGLTGTVKGQFSFDNVTWIDTYLFANNPGYNIALLILSGTGTWGQISLPPGANFVRIIVSAYTSGSASTLISTSDSTLPTVIPGGFAASSLDSSWAVSLNPSNNYVKLTDGNNVQAIKAASTAAVAGDMAAVVTLSPNNPVSGAVTTAAPSYTTGTTRALSLNTAGGLRVDGSGVTQPISGTVAATQSGTWTVQPGNTANTTPWLTSISQGGNTSIVRAGSSLPATSDAALVVTLRDAVNPNTATQTFTAGGQALTLALNGQSGAAIWFPAGITAIFRADASFNNGANWSDAYFYDSSTGVSSNTISLTGTQTGRSISLSSGATHVRIVCTTYTSGSTTAVAVTSNAYNTQSALYSGPTGSTTAGLPNVAIYNGASVTTSAPSYTNGTMGGLSLNTSGRLRIEQAQDIAGFATGSLAALNDNVFLVLSGQTGAAMFIGVGLTGTITPQVQLDGFNWVNTVFINPVTGATEANIALTGQSSGRSIVVPPGATTVRVTCSAYTSGSANINVSATRTGLLIPSTGPLNNTLLPINANLAGGLVTTSAPTYTTGTMNGLSLTTGGLLRVDSSGTTQPVSGTVTVTQSTAANLNATVVQSTAANLRSQTASEATTATATGTVASLTGGAVTTAAPTYTTGQMNALSLTTAGALRIDGSAVTQPVSGTVTAAQATAANLNATVVQSTAANLRTQTAAEATTGTSTGTVAALIGGAVTTAAPTYTTGQMSALSLDTTGSLRVNVTAGGGSNASVSTTGTTPPGSATYIGGSVTTSNPTYTNGQMAALSLDTTGQLRVAAGGVADGYQSGTLGALNATVSITLTGKRSAGVQLNYGNLIGTLIYEYSLDGTTWLTGNAEGYPSFAVSNLNTIIYDQFNIFGGLKAVRVRVSAYTSGSATAALATSDAPDTGTTNSWLSYWNQVGQPIGDGYGNRVGVTYASDTNSYALQVDSRNTDNTASANLGALNAAVTVATYGHNGAGYYLKAGTLVGTIVFEFSMDNQTTWLAGTFVNGATGINISSSQSANSLPLFGGTTHIRIRVSSYTSGTSPIVLTASNTDKLVPAMADNSLFFPDNGRAMPAGYIFDDVAGTAVGENNIAVPRIDSKRATVSTIEDGTVRGQRAAVSSAGSLQIEGPGLLGAPAGGVLTVQGADNRFSGAFTGLNASWTVNMAGSQGAGFGLTSGTLIGTVVAEISHDGTNWVQTSMRDPVTGLLSQSLIFASSNPTVFRSIVVPAGAYQARVRISAFTSGTCQISIAATQLQDIIPTNVTDTNTPLPLTTALVGGQAGGIIRNIKVNRAGHLRTGFDTLLAADSMEGSTVNTALWTQATTTMTIAQANGVITLNSGSSVATTTNANLVTNKQFVLFNHGILKLGWRISVTQGPTNAFIELGLGNPSGGTATISNGAFIRINGTALSLVTAYNGTEDSVSQTITLTNSTYYMAYMFVDEDEVKFVIEDVSGIPILDVSKTIPSTTPFVSATTHLSAFARVRNSAAVGSAAQLRISSFNAVLFDFNTGKPWSEQLAGTGRSFNIRPDTFAQAVTSAAAAAPTAFTPNNTGTTALTTLGGEYVCNATATSEAFLGIFAFTVPSPYTFCITDLYITPPVVTTTMGATLTIHQYALMVGNSVSPSGATGQRYPIGHYSVGASAAAGTIFSGQALSFNYRTPIIVNPGQILLIMVKAISGIATGAYRGAITVNGYYE